MIDRVLAPNGVLMGDDWYPGVHQKHHGVFRAVNEFLREADYQFVAAGRGAQWCIRRTPTYR